MDQKSLQSRTHNVQKDKCTLTFLVTNLFTSWTAQSNHEPKHKHDAVFLRRN